MVTALYLPVHSGPQVYSEEEGFSSERVNTLIGGGIEGIAVPNGGIGYIHKDGKLINLPRNDFATMMLAGYLFPHDYIAGPLLIFGPVQGEQETSVSDDLIKLYHECWEEFSQWKEQG